MPSMMGVTLAKIDGKFWVNVVNATWDVDKDVPVAKTGGGIRIAEGLGVMTGSFDEIIPVDGVKLDVANLKDFSIQIYDQPTQKVLVMSSQRCTWNKGSGSSAVEGANTRRKWTWKAEEYTKW